MLCSEGCSIQMQKDAGKHEDVAVSHIELRRSETSLRFEVRAPLGRSECSWRMPRVSVQDCDRRNVHEEKAS